MNLSVIIPTYNRAHTLRLTLESLLQQDFGPENFEIIVVDNDSQDDTAIVVQQLQLQSTVSLRYALETRPGVHFARNNGARLSRGQILYFTDDDMVAQPDMLRQLVRLFEIDPLIGAATGMVLPRWESEPPAWVRALCLNSVLSLQGRTEELIVSREDFGVFSCHEAIRRAVLFECGGFNPENTNGEWVGDGETGLNQKLRARGYKFAYSSNAVVHHLIPVARMTQRYFNSRMRNQGYADAYSWFRAVRPDRRRLTRNQMRCLYMCCCHAWLAAVSFSRRRHEWRLNRAHIAYHYARFLYNRRLRDDSGWREFVLKDDWIHEVTT